MRFDGFYVGNINIVYVIDFVLAYSLSYTRYSTIDPYDTKKRTNNTCCSKTRYIKRTSQVTRATHRI